MMRACWGTGQCHTGRSEPLSVRISPRPHAVVAVAAPSDSFSFNDLISPLHGRFGLFKALFSFILMLAQKREVDDALRCY